MKSSTLKVERLYLVLLLYFQIKEESYVFMESMLVGMEVRMQGGGSYIVVDLR